MRSLITSTARSDIRFASSWIVIASGSTISRVIFSRCSCAPWPLSLCVRRRNDATERVRSSSLAVALATVSRPRLRSAPRGGRGVGINTFCGMMGERPGGRGGSARPARLRGRRRGFAARQAPARFFLALPLEVRLLRPPELFLALARLGRFAFGPLARLAIPARLGVRLLAAAVLLLLRTRVLKRA